MNVLKFFEHFVEVFSDNEKKKAESYLAESENHYDLENRMAEIEHGRAPFQRRKYPWPL